MKKIIIIIYVAVVLMIAAYSQVAGNTQPQTLAEVVETPGEIVETPIETPVETIVEEAKEEIIVEPVAIDPDTKPEGENRTYREIRDSFEQIYAALESQGLSHEQILEEKGPGLVYFGTNLEELSRVAGYGPLGGEKQAVASNKTETPKTVTEPKTTTAPVPTPAPTPAPKPTQPSGKISQYGYEITDLDADGNGIMDSIQDNYANSDGTVSLPSGTPNPFEMAGDSKTEYPITDNDKNGNGIRDDWEDSYANTDGTVSLPEGTENPFEMP